MHASPHDQRRVLDLVALDLRLRTAEATRANPPQAARVKELLAERTEIAQSLTKARGEVDDARAEQGRIESDLKVVEARIARDNARAAGSTQAKEAQSLEHEIASLLRRKSDLEDAELALMERVEEAEAVVAGIEQHLAATNAEGTALSAAAKETVAAAESDIQAASRDRAAVADSLPADLVAQYDRLRARGVGAGLLRGRTCEGCRMELAGSELSAMRHIDSDVVAHCPECGCILVRTEVSAL
ncbi:C4-type zinc ribbon domain-containing protein [Microbacterium sediminicola]|uniref:C4-type zinc ribbon domain-containing protein n=1 Tax=Microbacterium sediminicola TaxID=415210 RepID=A0ABN2HSL0_9MICO